MGLKGSRPVVGAWRGGALSSATNLIFDLPFTMTEYYSTASDLRWYSMLSEADRTTSRYLNNLAGAVQTYTAGTTVSERWNSPVIGPSQAYRGDSPEWVSRTGDTINAQPALTGDGAGHSGNGSSTSATVVLKRDGTEIASADDTFLETDVPAGPATYRLEATLQRESSFDLSTNISAAWTFRSDTASGATPTPLPLWNVSFLPTLNAANAAPAGRTFAIPATVSVQPGSTTASPSTVSVQYSTDDGTTWRNATVSGSNTSRTVTVAHPDANGFVSLKATVSDSAGNSVEQTIIRAYKIAR
jgi:hypothetical protein